MHWDLDPDFALQSRLSLGRGAARWIGVAVLGSIAAFFVVPSEAVQTILAILGLMLIIVAAPYGALQLIAHERSGRLDSLRLIGRGPLAWTLASIFGSSWLFLVSAVPLLVGAHDAAPSLLEVSAVLLLGLAVAIALLGSPQLRDADGRMLLGLLLLIGLGAAWAGLDAPDRLAVLVCAATVAGMATLPAALRQTKRSAVFRRHSPRNPLRWMVPLSRSRAPELSRALLMAGVSVAAAGFLAAQVVAGVGVRLWSQWPRPQWNELTAPFVLMFVYVAYSALAIAAFACSTQARLERTSGGLDRVRLSSQSPWFVVLQMAVGHALPLVLLSLASIGALWLVHPASTAVPIWPGAAALVIFSGLAEGFQGRRLGTYLFPAVAVCAVWQLQGTAWWLLLLTAFLPATSAAGCLAEDGEPRKPMVTVMGAAIMAAACTLVPPRVIGFGTGVNVFRGDAVTQLNLIAMLEFSPALVIASTLALGAAVLFPSGRERLRTIAFGCAGAGAGAAMIDALARPPFSMPAWTIEGAATAGLFAAAGLLFGSLVQRRFADTPTRALAARAAPLIAVMLLWTRLVTLDKTTPQPLYHVLWDVWFLASIGTACVILLLLDRARADHAPRHRS